MDAGFDILYEDGPCCGRKPPGVLTQARGHRQHGGPCQAFLQQRDGVEELNLGCPTRLDRPASGVMLLAKDLRATRKWAGSSNPQSPKVYSACVTGGRPGNRTWEDFV